MIGNSDCRHGVTDSWNIPLLCYNIQEAPMHRPLPIMVMSELARDTVRHCTGHLIDRTAVSNCQSYQTCVCTIEVRSEEEATGDVDQNECAEL